MADVARLLRVIGDDSRRTILETVAGGERSVSEICAAVGMRQPAVSQHLKVLREAGVVTQRAEGNRRLYRVDLQGLTPLRSYLDRFWDDALAAFAAYADQPEHATTTSAPPPPPASGSPSSRRRKDSTA